MGDTITIDETMLQHFSKAARQAKELHFMPKKPHPYGLKQFRAVTLLCHTNKRAILSILPVKPPTNYTPTQAALEIIEQVQPHVQQNLHVILDSAFCTLELVAALHHKPVTVSLSFKPNNLLEYSELYNTAIEGLRAEQTRRYRCDEWIIEAHHVKEKPKENHSGIQSVISNAWEADIKTPEPIRRLLTYNIAATLWLESNDIELAIVLGQPVGTAKRDSILNKLRWDPILPPPDASGRQAITQVSLAPMRKKQIVALHAFLQCQPPVGKKKENYIEAILKHPQPQSEHQHVAARTRASATDVSSLRTKIGQVADDSHQLIDFYNHHYGLVDQTNEEIYRSILLADYKSYIKLRTFSILHALIVNAWACFQDDTASHPHQNDTNQPKSAVHSFREFVLALANQLLAE